MGIWLKEKEGGIIMLDFKTNEEGKLDLYCETCESFDCWHVEYAWTLPATRDMYIKELEKAIVLVQNSKK